jgi:hypothetical protein
VGRLPLVQRGTQLPFDILPSRGTRTPPQIETNSSLQSKFDRNLFYTQLGDMDSRIQEAWRKCHHLADDLLPFVVRIYCSASIYTALTRFLLQGHCSERTRYRCSG